MTSKVSQLIHHLEQLQATNYEKLEDSRAHNADADAALRLIFHIGRQKITFTEEQMQKVAKNLVAAIVPIQINIEGASFQYRKRLNTIILKKRSALQFLVDTYGMFRVQETRTLSAEFQRVNLNETIGLLDKIIEEYRDESDSDDANSDRDFPGIPSSHSWWL